MSFITNFHITINPHPTLLGDALKYRQLTIPPHSAIPFHHSPSLNPLSISNSTIGRSRHDPMELEFQSSDDTWNKILEFTKASQRKSTEPNVWAIKVMSILNGGNVLVPCVEVAEVVVNHICWGNNVPICWKYLERGLVNGLLPPMVVLALLSVRVIPNRRCQPPAYRLYLELVKRYAFTFAQQIHSANCQKILKSLEDVLHLSQVFGLQVSDTGVLVVVFVFSILCQLVDALLDDEELLELTPEKKSKWATRSQEMEIDGSDDGVGEHHEKLLKANSVMTIELINKLFQNKLTSRLLYLVHKNMPSHWGGLLQRLHILGPNFSALKNLILMSPEALLQLSTSPHRLLSRENKSSLQQESHAVMASGALSFSAGHCHGASRTATWLPLDLFLEDVNDGSQVTATSTIDAFSCLIKSLQAFNGTTWHDTFLALWFSAIRHVQRERDPNEGPVPQLDTRLCMLLSITTLAIMDIIEEEEFELTGEAKHHPTSEWNVKQIVGKRRMELISSLRMLGDYESLLSPPQSIIPMANRAAAKAMMFKSGLKASNGYVSSISMNDMPITCSGNLRHLIVEACLARNLLDTSAYLWPGYVNEHINQSPNSAPIQLAGWSALMKGAPLTPSMVNALVSTPASSLAELEKIFDIAVNGSVDDKISAATILCGASFVRGWNIQEYTVHFVTQLLALPVPADYSGSDSHLLGCAPFINTILVGLGTVDAVQILSLHGLIPELAGTLMSICEVFGSCIPKVLWTLPTGEEINTNAVFSNAFILLLRLWRFNHAPLEHVICDVPQVWTQLTPEYLLLVRNSQVVARNTNMPRYRSRNNNKLPLVHSTSTEPIFVDSFPKLKLWYRQHQACIASTLSGLVHGTPVHQIVDVLLQMMFKTILNKGENQTLTSGSSSSSGPGSLVEDASTRPTLPAWEILEAAPFVVDAALTACSNGRLSPRELATGLKDLADFLPASLATIVSYFSAEVTRGVWKPVYMNGTDWPSPAANLSNTEEQIKRILACTGVDVPSLAEGASSQAILPLPLAAFVSLTITYKLSRASERLLNLVGPALETLAAGCPWPCMPIVASLWVQKVKRWGDFLIFSASRTVFQQNNDAVVQLLKSCFTSTLGLNGTPMSSNGGVGALLGHGFCPHFYTGGFSAVAPGILYLRVHKYIRNIMFMTEKVLSLLLFSVKEIAANDQQNLKKTKYGLRYVQVSLAAAMTKVKLVASLGASLIWLSGGPGLVQSLIQDTLPSWFLSTHGPEPEGMSATLDGYALAYFAVMSGVFAWGVDSVSPNSRRPKVIGRHFVFLASAIDGKISLGCDATLWRAYLLGFVSLMIFSTPTWLLEVDINVLKRLSMGLKRWNEDELALALLGNSGVRAINVATELIIACE